MLICCVLVRTEREASQTEHQRERSKNSKAVVQHLTSANIYADMDRQRALQGHDFIAAISDDIITLVSKVSAGLCPYSPSCDSLCQDILEVQ